MNQIPKPSVGRVVQFGLGYDAAGEVVYRPATVVELSKNLGPKDSPLYDDHAVQLQVLVDGRNDLHVMVDRKTRAEAGPVPAVTEEEANLGMAWRTSVDHGEDVGQWRWPPRI